jgi:hypothetical protein
MANKIEIEQWFKAKGLRKEGQTFHLHALYLNKIFRCLYRWCPPLPIPNREVKPTRADGTAVTRGRVGRCQILKEPFSSNVEGFSSFINISVCQSLSFSTIKELRQLRHCLEHAFLNSLNPLMVNRGGLGIILYSTIKSQEN